jgi:hypothetical protein
MAAMCKGDLPNLSLALALTSALWATSRAATLIETKLGSFVTSLEALIESQSWVASSNDSSLPHPIKITSSATTAKLV